VVWQNLGSGRVTAYAESSAAGTRNPGFSHLKTSAKAAADPSASLAMTVLTGRACVPTLKAL
jgi:hypothetical protein